MISLAHQSRLVKTVEDDKQPSFSILVLFTNNRGFNPLLGLVHKLIHFFFFLAPLGRQNMTSIFNNLRVLLSRKLWWTVRIGSFCQKLRYFQTRMDQRGDLMKTIFDYFQIQRWMLKTDKKKLRWKIMGSFV